MRKFALVLVFIFFIFSKSQAQTCDTPANLKAMFIGNGLTPGSDGLVHASYAFTDSNGTAISNPGMQADFDKAFQAWNQYSNLTGVVFSAAKAGDQPDISITGDNNKSNGCIASNASTLNMSYGPDWSKRFTDPVNSPGNVIGVEHEIGHLLGSLDNNPSTGTSIMNQATSCAAGSNATGILPSDAQSVKDATAVGGCVKRAISSHNSSGGGGGGGGYCIVYYTDTYHYTWNDGWHLNTIEQSVDDVECY